jgi:hypothetical protein
VNAFTGLCIDACGDCGYILLTTEKVKMSNSKIGEGPQVPMARTETSQSKSVRWQDQCVPANLSSKETVKKKLQQADHTQNLEQKHAGTAPAAGKFLSVSLNAKARGKIGKFIKGLVSKMKEMKGKIALKNAEAEKDKYIKAGIKVIDFEYLDEKGLLKKGKTHEERMQNINRFRDEVEKIWAGHMESYGDYYKSGKGNLPTIPFKQVASTFVKSLFKKE